MSKVVADVAGNKMNVPVGKAIGTGLFLIALFNIARIVKDFILYFAAKQLRPPPQKKGRKKKAPKKRPVYEEEEDDEEEEEDDEYEYD